MPGLDTQTASATTLLPRVSPCSLRSRPPPFTGSVRVNLKHYPSGANVGTQTTSTGFFTFVNRTVGRYIVEIVPPLGATPLGPLFFDNVFVTCDMETPMRFQLNRPPTADAGPDQAADEFATVNLSGTGSSDPDHDPLAFA
ncbi:MAG: hypothetical protein EXR55_00910 [Dehalococcoidia bacterium]|nr:hypothetical protein [Dehalococcoidia bacterium]